MSDNDRPPIQSSAHARRAALERFRQWGARNLVKVTSPGEIRQEVHGYITFMQAIAGKSPEEIARTLGLRATDLVGGALIYRLDRIPHENEFEVRGYTTLIDGKPSAQNATQDSAGYRVGTGALQYEILRNAPIPATLLGLLKPGETFDLRTIRRPGATATIFSGAEWWHANQQNYANSAEISDLAPSFATQVGGFIRALEAGGATVLVAATRRNRLRAYLMHYCWRLANRDIAAAKVPLERKVPIIWDHGNEALSRQAAQEMLDLFDVVYKPSLTSNHIVGRAVDMKISWTEPFLLKDARGREVLIDRPREDAVHPGLHAVGATYGVRKLRSDAPHWSTNGH